jgi:hypothetical protein
MVLSARVQNPKPNSKPMFGKHHAHLKLPKVKVVTIELFQNFQRLHLERQHFIYQK